MKILAFDTAMNACSVCLYDTETKRVISRIEPMVRGHAEVLMPMIEAVLKDSDTGFDVLDMIAVTKGPGAFTGMRIGIATAKALALSLNIPCVGVCTFEAVLQTFFAASPERGGNPENSFMVLLETKREDYYVKAFTPEGITEGGGVSLVTGQIQSLAAWQGRIAVGDGVSRFISEADGMQGGVHTHQIDFPAPEEIAYLAEKMYMGACHYGCDFSPVYLRSADVSPPKRPARYIRDVLVKNSTLEGM